MKLQARFLLLYTFLFAGVAGFLLLQRAIDLDRSRTVLQHELTQHHAYFEKITTVEGHSLSNLSTDYSYWDDMVTFVKTSDLKFAKENIEPALATYGADAVWIYRPNQTLVYYKSADDDASAKQVNLPAAAFTKLATDRLDHFYVQEPKGLMEVRGAIIVPSNDPTRATPAQGYWLVGRYLDAELIASLANLTQSDLTLGPANTSLADRTTASSVTFGVKLPAWDDQTAAVMTLTAPVPVEKDLQNLYTRQLVLLMSFFMASIFVIVASIWRLVLRPVKLIARSISVQQPELLDGLSGRKGEFGSLAQTVQLSFRQQLKIQESEFLKNKLEELNKAKSEFLAIAAHEMKGPVGNVHIFAENLSDLIEIPTTTKEVLHGEVERISLQAHKATILINDIYQASKGGQALELVKSEFDFDDFVRREVENAQYSAQQKLEIEGNTGQKVVSDPDRLGQVMTNLIRNASKYSSPELKIVIRLSYLNNMVQVEVQDYGLGIAPEDQDKLFQRFFRSSRVAESYPGLGLGLSVCREIIVALGGEIWVASELGKGSHFFFTLPVSPTSRELS